MRALIVHLSDIHIQTKDDPIFQRSEAISFAIGSLRFQQEICILLISGDIAAAGNEDQFYLAYFFIESIIERLTKLWEGKVKIEVVAIPGNHDCKFEGDLGARNDSIEKMLELGTCAPDASVIRVCTEVQIPFFEFLNQLSTKPKIHSKLYYEYDFLIGKEKLVFRCFNTSWISVKKESPGNILIPEPDTMSSEASLAFTVMHHPLFWFHKNTRRNMQRMLNNVSDIVFTGHEHVQDTAKVEASTGDVVYFIEGGCLQETSDGRSSEFSALVIDIGTRADSKQKLVKFAWNGSMYSEDERAWMPLTRNPLRSKTPFALSKESSEWLDDVGMMIDHPEKEVLGLRDIFVFPDLRRSANHEFEEKLIRSTELVEEVFSHPISMIRGAELSGKTCLAKSLYVQALEKGLIPLYLDGEPIKVFGDDRAYDQLKSAFASQYSKTEYDRYSQLPKSARCLIIDDFDKGSLRTKRSVWPSFISRLTDFFGRIIILSNDVLQDVEDILGASVFVDQSVCRFRILGFGASHRDQLVEKWLGLYGEDFSDVEHFERRAIIERLLDSMIGTQFLPPYPYYILPLIRTADSTSPIHTRAASQAFFAEVLIKASLTRPDLEVDHEACMGSLMYLAYSLFKRRKIWVSEAEFQEIHKQYQIEYLGSHVDFQKLKRSVIHAKLLRERNGEFSFRYKHIYHYFCAAYLDRNIEDDNVKEQIVEMSNNLYRDEFSNILLFLAYMTPSQFVINEMLSRAKEFYDSVSPTRLEDDVSFLDKFADDNDLSKFSFDELTSARQKRLDSDRSAIEPDDSADDLQDEPFDRIMSPFLGSLKMIQILGQMLKNRSETTKAGVKLEVAKECHLLGLRILGHIFDLVRGHEDELVLDIATTLLEDQTQPPPPVKQQVADQLAASSRRIVRSIIRGASFGMIKRISFSLGSQNLLETHHKLLEASPSVAMRLIFTAMTLEQARLSLPEVITEAKDLENRPLPFDLLRLLVTEHIHLYPTELPDKQKLAAALKIKPPQGSDPRKRLLK